MAQKSITLQSWIKETGSTEIAKTLDIDRSTVRHWKCGYGLPKAKQMLAIKRLTKGRLTCDAMIENYFDKKACAQ